MYVVGRYTYLLSVSYLLLINMSKGYNLITTILHVLLGLKWRKRIHLTYVMPLPCTVNLLNKHVTEFGLQSITIL